LVHVSSHERFEGIFWVASEEGKRLATLNLAPGKRVYGEELIEYKEAEYRIWNPFRSKIAAAILKEIKELPILPKITLLYLGVASGTTCSHVSDIIGTKGHIFGVDFAPRSMRDFIENLAKVRGNISPILADARSPLSYRMIVPKVEAIYSDVAQPDQAKIMADNAEVYLKNGGWGIMAIKARSIDVAEEPSVLYNREVEFLRTHGFTIVDLVNLEPYEKDHAMVVAQYRKNSD
jgi:fibrillarin-like pre-rRNA processing protein